MSVLYRELAQRFRDEVRDLDQVVQRALYAWERLTTTTIERDVYLDSVALNLHSFYSGLERLFELVTRHLDRASPPRATWHRDLLRIVSQEVVKVRPAVIDKAIARDLDQFRRFRHLVRNVYTSNLQPERMIGMMQILPELWPGLRVEISAFADFLDRLAQQDENPERDR